MAGKRWEDLSGKQKAGVAATGTVQAALLLAALTDLYRRPAEGVRGPKALWAVASFVNFVGPVSYFLFGRRR